MPTLETTDGKPVAVDPDAVNAQFGKHNWYTQPDKLQQLLLAPLHLTLPDQAPPVITKGKVRQQCSCSVNGARKV